MRYHIQSKLGTGPSGDVLLGVGDWLGARPVAIRFITLNDHEAQNLRVQAERLAMIDHPGLGLIEDISPTGSDDVLIATTLADSTLAAADPADLPLDDLLSTIDAVATALDALHRSGLHHGHVSTSNIMVRGDLTFLGDTGLKTFRTHMPRNTGQDRRRQDVVDLVGLARTLTAATGDANGSRRARSVLALCETMTARPNHYTSPRHHLAAFREGLAEISGMPEVATTPPTIRVANERTPPPNLEPPGTSPPVSRRGDLRKPLAAAAAVLLITVGAVLGVRWSAPAKENTASAPGDTARGAGGGDATGSLAGVSLESCPIRGAGGAGVPDGSHAIEGTVDLDGDGCPEQIAWSALRAELTVRSSAADGQVSRFRLGEPGDEFLLGDWDCSGQATPGLYRPSTGETYLFDRWASDTEPASATPGPVLDGDSLPTVSAPEDGCDRIITTDPSL